MLLLLLACGDVSITKVETDNDHDGYNVEVDCDDAHQTVNPDAEEICDGLDNNCDGEVDNDVSEAPAWYVDSDGDGYGDPTVSESACTAPNGFVA
jgi:Putative metal-binding motif